MSLQSDVCVNASSPHSSLFPNNNETLEVDIYKGVSAPRGAAAARPSGHFGGPGQGDHNGVTTGSAGGDPWVSLSRLSKNDPSPRGRCCA